MICMDLTGPLLVSYVPWEHTIPIKEKVFASIALLGPLTALELTHQSFATPLSLPYLQILHPPLFLPLPLLLPLCTFPHRSSLPFFGSCSTLLIANKTSLTHTLSLSLSLQVIRNGQS